MVGERVSFDGNWHTANVNRPTWSSFREAIGEPAHLSVVRGEGTRPRSALCCVCLNMGEMYLNGWGVGHNYGEATLGSAGGRG